MLSQPKISHRSEQHYVAIARTVHMTEIPDVLPPLIPVIEKWMHEHNMEATGPTFFLYKSMNDKGELDCEAGIPVAQAAAGDDPIMSGVFPAGKYASITYTGDYENMMEGHIALERWIAEQGFKEKSETVNGTTQWGGRAEFYIIDSDSEPDPAKWQTEIVFSLED